MNVPRVTYPVYQFVPLMRIAVINSNGTAATPVTDYRSKYKEKRRENYGIRLPIKHEIDITNYINTLYTGQ